MISRRQFMMIAAALDAAGTSLVPVSSSDAIGAPAVPLPPESPFVPTGEQVRQWLEWYKAWVSGDFKRIVASTTAGPSDPGEWKLDAADPRLTWYTEVRGPGALAIIDDVTFERAMNDLERTRQGVAHALGEGYTAGREGLARSSEHYRKPSNELFAWYNGWDTGDFDRRWRLGEVSLPRSPGVTFPAGDPRGRGRG